ncbi:potassium channel family protein [Vogesella sp. GCM10023246]|uniref:Potassium channel family protein n=1 Tax=Vogesella oryzagri TaxID=3160864 RepID=A0ABV1M7H4_9NEIS
MGRALALKLVSLLGLIMAVVVMGTLGYHLLEGWSVFDSLYMTVITLATIGYGETHALDNVGRIFTILLIIFGTGVVGYGLSSLTLMLFQGDLPVYLRKKKMDKLISRLENHVVICGLSRSGLYALEELHQAGHNIVVIEQNEAHAAQLLAAYGTPYIVGDATEDANLLAAGIARARALITSLTSDANNAFVVVTARSLNPQLTIVSKAETESARKKLQAVGANQVVIPSYLGGMNMASLVANPQTMHFFERLHSRYPHAFRAEVLPVLDEWVGRSIAECLPIAAGNMMVIAVELPGGEVQFNPPLATILHRDESLMVIGQHAQNAFS